MADDYANHSPSLTTPLIGGFGITPNDAVDLARTTRQIRITGSGGDIVVVWADGSQSTEPVAAGDVHDWRLRRVLATGTTATGIRGYV